MPFFFEAAIFVADMLTSDLPFKLGKRQENWAKDKRILSVRRPIDVVVSNCCVTETNETFRLSKISTILAKYGQRPG